MPASTYEKLNRQQQRFVDHYVLTGRGIESARYAGYHDVGSNLATRASKLLKNQFLQQAIAEKQEKLLRNIEKKTEDVSMSVEEIWINLNRIIRHGKSEANRVKAIELAAKMKGMLVERSLVLQKAIGEYEQLAKISYPSFAETTSTVLEEPKENKLNVT